MVDDPSTALRTGLDVLLVPILDALRPKRVFELAAPRASKAAVVLEKSESQLVSAGPHASEHVDALRARFGERFRHVDAVPVAEDVDLAILLAPSVEVLRALAGGERFPVTLIADHSEKAIDEFLSSKPELSRIVLPGLGGTCVVFDGQRPEAALVRDLKPAAALEALLAAVERARLEACSDLENCRMRTAERASEIARLSSELAEARLLAEERSLRIAALEAQTRSLEDVVVAVEHELSRSSERSAGLEAQNQRLVAARSRAAEKERELAAQSLRMVELRTAAEEESRARIRLEAENATLAARLDATAEARPTNGTAETPVVEAGSLELARRRLSKLRRDPKLFLAHSRFGLARKLARLF